MSDDGFGESGGSGVLLLAFRVGCGAFRLKINLQWIWQSGAGKRKNCRTIPRVQFSCKHTHTL